MSESGESGEGGGSGGEGASSSDEEGDADGEEAEVFDRRGSFRDFNPLLAIDRRGWDRVFNVLLAIDRRRWDRGFNILLAIAQRGWDRGFNVLLAIDRRGPPYERSLLRWGLLVALAGAQAGADPRQGCRLLVGGGGPISLPPGVFGALFLQIQRSGAEAGTARSPSRWPLAGEKVGSCDSCERRRSEGWCAQGDHCGGGDLGVTNKGCKIDGGADRWERHEGKSTKASGLDVDHEGKTIQASDLDAGHRSGAGVGGVSGGGRAPQSFRRHRFASPAELRRERIAERMKALQELVPNANKTDKASMLDEIIDYVKFLQLQVKVLSMSRLGGAAAVAVADVQSEARGGGGARSQAAAAATAAAKGGGDSLTLAEHQVAKLMEEDMGAAMQYLQGKGLCLMPISLASAISTATCHSRPGVHPGGVGNQGNGNLAAMPHAPSANGDAPTSPSMSVLTVQSAMANGDGDAARPSAKDVS